LNVSVKVFNNCGVPLDDFVATAKVKAGSETDVAARAVFQGTKSGIKTQTRLSHAVGATEGDLIGHLYPYFRDTSGGVTLQIEVQAPNPTGGELEGLIDMPLAIEADPAAPQVALGAMVPNGSFEPVPLAINDIFGLFTIVPGLTDTDNTRVPFAKELGGVEVVIDGNRNVPLIYAHNGLVTGLIPVELSDGEHIVNLLYRGERMSGAIPFSVARANPTVIVYGQNNAHLYHSDGTPVTRANPGVAGEVLAFYAVGIGDVDGTQLVTGDVTPATLLPARLKCQIDIGGNPLDLIYCGMSPGAVVLAQANFALTTIAAPGTSAGDVVQMSVVLNQEGYNGSQQALGWFRTGLAQQPINVGFQASYPDARFSVNNQLYTGVTKFTGVTPGTSFSLDVPADPQQPGAGKRYYFYGWSQGGARQQTVAPAVSTQYGVYFLVSYLLTINGTATRNPAPADGYYTQTANAFAIVTVTGSCPGGASPTGLLVTTASGSTTLPNPSTIVMNEPKTVTVQCPPPPPSNTCLTPRPQGMIGWYPFDELTGATAANILGPSAWNGSYQNSPAPLAAGYVAGALGFHNGWVEVNDPAAYNVTTGDFTIDTWVKFDATAGPGGLYALMEKLLPGGYGWALRIRSNRLMFSMKDTFTNVYRSFLSPSGKTNFFDNQWHHVAVTVRRATNGGTFYADGVLVSTFNAGLNPGSLSNVARASIGYSRVYTGAGRAFWLDELEVFNRAVSAVDIQSIFAASRLGKCKPTPGSGYSVTATGCNVTVGPASSQISPGVWPPNTTPTVNATAPVGGLVNVSVTMGGTTTTYTSVPFTFQLTGNATIVAECPAKPDVCVDAPGGIVGWYALDETNSSATTFADLAASPAPLALVLNPGLGVSPLPAKVQGGWQFTGATSPASSYLGTQFIGSYLASNAAKYNFGTGDFSIDAWVSLFANTTTPLVWKMTAGANPVGFNLALDNNYVRLDLGDGTTVGAWVGTQWKVGNTVSGGHDLHHVMVTVSRANKTVQIYVDGKIETLTQTGSMPTGSLNDLNNPAQLRIGGNRVLLLDEIELFKSALSATDAQALYLAGANGKCKVCAAGGPGAVLSPAAQSALKAWWSMETAGPSVTDVSGNGHHGITATPYLLNTSVVPAFALTPPAVISGKVGSALNFANTLLMQNNSQSGAGIKVPYHSDFDLPNTGPGTGVTLDAWVYIDPSDPENGGTVLGNRRIQGNSAYAFAVSAATGPTFYAGNIGSVNGYDIFPPSPSDRIPITTAGWHFVALRLRREPSGTTTDVWVDGVRKTSFDSRNVLGLTTLVDNYLSPGTFATGVDLYIGGYGWSTNFKNVFTGGIDELEFFNAPISDADIEAIYRAGAAGKCPPGPTQAFPVTVNTNPANINATVGLTAPTAAAGLATNQYVYANGTAGQYIATVSPTTITGTSTEYRFNNTWSFNGTLDASLGTGATTLPKQVTAAATFTANFDTYYRVGAEIGTCGSQPPIPQWVKAGSPGLTVSIAALGGQIIRSVMVNGVSQTIPPSGPVSVTVNPVTGPITIVAVCGLPFSVTVNTSPANIGATVGLTSPPSGVGTALNTYTYSNAVPAAYVATVNPTQITSGSTQYRLKNWSVNGLIQSAWTLAATPSYGVTATATFTANFDTYYLVTLTLTGCTAQTNVAGLGPGSGTAYVLAGSSLSATVAPGSGQVIQSATLNGASQTVLPNGTVVINVNPVTGPQTLVATCGQPVANPNLDLGFVSKTTGANTISVTLRLTNTGGTASNVQVNQVATTLPGSLATPMPIGIGNIPAGANRTFTVIYGFPGAPPTGAFNISAFWSYMGGAGNGNVTVQ
jgi:uncharacterized protein (TIGR03437 family)